MSTNNIDRAKFIALLDDFALANQRVGSANPAIVVDPYIDVYRRNASEARAKLVDLVFPPPPAGVPTVVGMATRAELDALNRKKPMSAAEWNSLYTEGTEVVVVLDDGRKIETKTRSEAWETGSHNVIVLVEGKSGGYALNRVLPKSPEGSAPVTPAR